MLIASAATGFAGALFNPAVRAYLAADTGDRRVEALAVFNMFYQAGIFAGPLIGLALMAVDFRVTAGVAAAVFAALTIAQLFALPARRGEAPAEKTSVLDDWRRVMSNQRFLAFSVAMIGSYVLSFQVYLALPLQAEFIAGAQSQTLSRHCSWSPASSPWPGSSASPPGCVPAGDQARVWSPAWPCWPRRSFR